MNSQHPQSQSNEPRLALELIKFLSLSGENLLVSPCSFYTCLSMLLTGAEGFSYQQLYKFLFNIKPKPNLPTIKKNLVDSNNSFLKRNESVLNMANFIYYNQNFQINQKYLQTLQPYGSVSVKGLNASDPEKCAKQVNDDVDKATRGMISEIVDKMQMMQFSMILINAIHFKSKWTKPFDSKHVVNRDFKPFSGNSFKVPVMSKDETYSHYHHEDLKVDTLKMEYQTGSIYMVIMLPDRDNNLKNLIDTLDTDGLKEILAKLNDSAKEPVRLLLPKFHIKNNLDLVQHLKRMGLTSIFDPKEACFHKMSDNPNFHVSNFIHKTLITVNCEGTEAAAVSGTVCLGCALAVAQVPPPTYKFEVDRPFMFLLLSDSRDHILFIGTVAKPEQPYPGPPRSKKNKEDKTGRGSGSGRKPSKEKKKSDADAKKKKKSPDQGRSKKKSVRDSKSPSGGVSTKKSSQKKVSKKKSRKSPSDKKSSSKSKESKMPSHKKSPSDKRKKITSSPSYKSIKQHRKSRASNKGPKSAQITLIIDLDPNSLTDQKKRKKTKKKKKKKSSKISSKKSGDEKTPRRSGSKKSMNREIEKKISTKDFKVNIRKDAEKKKMDQKKSEEKKSGTKVDGGDVKKLTSTKVESRKSTSRTTATAATSGSSSSHKTKPKSKASLKHRNSSSISKKPGKEQFSNMSRNLKNSRENYQNPHNHNHHLSESQQKVRTHLQSTFPEKHKTKEMDKIKKKNDDAAKSDGKSKSKSKTKVSISKDMTTGKGSK